MMGKTTIYMSDNENLLPVPKTELLGNSLRPPDREYQKKEKEAIIIKKDLPADHLTATYWG
jgi:hypothetical protein